MTVARAYDAESLDELSDQVRELWFSLDDLRCDPAAKTVTVPLLHPSRGRGGVVRVGDRAAGALVIHAAVDTTIEDDARIGSYEVAAITTRPSPRGIVVELTSSFPLRVLVDASVVDVAFTPVVE